MTSNLIKMLFYKKIKELLDINIDECGTLSDIVGRMEIIYDINY